MGSDAITLNLLKKLVSTDFSRWVFERLVFKVTWCNQYKFLVFGNIKRVFRFVFKLIFFFLKLNWILTKIDISCVKFWLQSARPTHPLKSISRNLWKDSTCEWPLKQTRLRSSFCLILKICTGWSVQCVI